MTLSPQNKLNLGALVLVVGPSGSGKDSLIARAKSEFENNPRFIFPRRVITRDAVTSAEDHETMSIQEFEHASLANQFALSWQAHGLAYGIRRNIVDALQAGRNVIANVSRQVITEAECLGFPVIIISVLCRPALLAERIAARGRETKSEILQRLTREASIVVNTARVIEIRNETTIDEAAENFIAALRQI